MSQGFLITFKSAKHPGAAGIIYTGAIQKYHRKPIWTRVDEVHAFSYAITRLQDFVLFVTNMT